MGLHVCVEAENCIALFTVLRKVESFSLTLSLLVLYSILCVAEKHDLLFYD